VKAMTRLVGMTSGKSSDQVGAAGFSLSIVLAAR
jgi:hypothetical protein